MPVTKITGELVGRESVKLDLEQLQGQSKQWLKEEVARYATAATAIALANVQGAVLKSRSGELADSVKLRLHEDATSVWAQIGTDFYVGRFWERGFNGSMDVRGHLRAVRTGARLTAIVLSKKGRRASTKVYEHGAAHVGPYHREMDGRPRPWLAPALTAVRDAFRQSVMTRAEEASKP